MKIEYIEETSGHKPFIRLYDFSNSEVLEIKKLIDRLIDGEVNEVPVHEHANINPIDNCRLRLRAGEENVGIRYLPQHKEFECVLTRPFYENMSQLINSFAEHSVEMQGFEWLDETSDISLLISPSGRWE